MRKTNTNDWNITVLGAGTMGLCVAQFFAMNGHSVSLYNRTPANLEKALVQIRHNLQTLVSMQQITNDDVPAALSRIQGYTDLEKAVANANFIIENVAEKEELKKDIFSRIDALCDEDVIFASDTSTMNIYEFLEVSHPERLIITHFFNPAYVMPLVEIVRGPKTSDKTVAEVKTLLESCGKKTAILNKAIPGFILNRITMAVFREASYIAGNGWATPEDIDKAIVSTFGPRYTFEGPFALSDFAGLDIYERLATLLPPVLCRDTSCPAILSDKTSHGELGVKSGKGFYSYEDAADAHRRRDQKIMRMLQAIQEVNRLDEA